MLLVWRQSLAARFSDLTRQVNMIQKSVKKKGRPLQDVGIANSSTAYFASMVDYVPEAVIAVDGERNVIGWNLAAERNYGWTAAEVMGKPLNDFLHTVHSGEETEDTAAIIAEDAGTWSGEVTQLQKDGMRIPVWSTVSAVRDEEGGVIGFIGINHDISGQKRAEELKRESEERYRRLFESMREVFFVCEIINDPAGKPIDIRYLDANPACLQRAHRKREEMVGHTYLELFPRNPTFETWLEKFSRVACSGAPENFEQFAEATGLYFEVFAFSPLPGQCAVVMNDVTEGKRAEQTVREKEIILSTAEEVAQIGSWRWDLRTQKVTWSDEMFRLFGVEREGFDGDVNRVIFERVHPDDAAAVSEANRSMLEDAQPVPLSYRIVLPDGAEHVVWAQGKMIRDEDGQPIALTGYVQDITERVKAEKKILQMKRLYATLSQVNQTIVRIKSRDELYRSICDIAVKFGELAAAWIGVLDEGTGELLPVAANGLDLNNWPMPIFNINNRHQHNLISAEALRNSTCVTSEDVQTDERTKSLHELLRKTKFHSLAAVPFQLQGKTIGVLNLLSGATGFFKSEEEILLLNEMGLDISFALDMMEAEKLKRQWADAFEHCAHGIVIGNPFTNQIITCNPAFARSQGETIQQLSSTPLLEMYAPQDRGQIKQFIDQSDRTGSVQFEAHKIRKDGSAYDVQMDLVSVRDENGDLLYRVATQQDITERKAAETALRESEQRYRLISNNAADVIWVLDPIAGRFTYISPSVVKLRGYTAEEVMAQPVSESLTPDSLKLVSESLAANLPPFIQKGEGTVSFVSEVDQPCKDGSIVHTEVTTTFLFNSKGQVEIVGVSRDITERKQAHEALRESETLFSKVFQSSPIGINIFDPSNGRSVNVNDAFLDIIGYSRGEIIDHSAAELNLFVDVEARNTWMKILREGGLVRNQDAKIRSKSGEIRNCLASLDIIEINGKPMVLVITSDITERNKAEEALRDANEKYRNIFENAVEAITQTTPEGRYISANPATARMLGYDSPEDLIAGLSDLDRQFYVKPGRREEFRKLMEQHGTISDFESEVYRKDGSRIWISENSHAIRDEHGKVLYYEGAGQDVTRRKHAEREIQQRAEDLLLISALNDAANHGEDIEGITEVFVHEARNMFSCQAASIYLLSADGKYIEMQSSTLPRKLTERIEKLIGHPIPRIRIPLRKDGYFQKILENEQGLITSDPREIQDWIDEFTDTTFLPVLIRAAIRNVIPQIYKILNIGSTISIPLVNSGRAFGVLDMSSKGQFTDEDLRRIRSISHQVTAVILRKQAEEQVQLQLERMRALSEIDRAISSSLDMRLSLDILLNQVISQLGVDAADVLLLNPSSQTLEYEAGKGFRSLSIRESRMVLGLGFPGRAGLERKIIHIPDIDAVGEQFLRRDLLKDEKFVEYFGIPLIAKGMVKGVLEVFHRTPLNPDVEWVNYLETLGGQAAIAIDNALLFNGMQQSNLELITAYDATIVGWSRAMDLRDKETEGHTQRVTELAVQLAKKMGMGQQDIVQLRRGALLHDIGKLGVPDQILHKPDKLTQIEWAIMRQHPTYAFNMLISINYLRSALDIPYCHHEKWDGAGYPRGLKGEEIPLAARVFAVVDVWDALRSDRPYRGSWPIEKVREYVIEESGKHFDPQIVDAFLQIIEDK